MGSQFCFASYSYEDGANIYLEYCGTMSIVFWEYEDSYFRDEHSGKCMAVEHNTGSQGQNVLLWSCNDDGQGSYRMWKYESFGPSPSPPHTPAPVPPQTKGSQIQWTADPFYCLTVKDNEFVQGQNLVLMQCQEGSE